MTSSPVLFAFDLKKKDELIKEYAFPGPVAGFGSLLSDFQVGLAQSEASSSPSQSEPLMSMLVGYGP